MSCDWYDGTSQQLRGRTKQRSIQGRPRRLNTTSPPKFSTNSSKVACKVCAPYYANKVSRRSLVHNETLDYNKAFAGKSAMLAVAELCGESRDWADSSGASGSSTNSSSYNGNNLFADDLITQLAISEALHDDDALLRNLYGRQPTLEVKLDLAESDEHDSVHEFALPTPLLTTPKHPMASVSVAPPHHRASTSQILSHSPDFTFPMQSPRHNRASTSQLSNAPDFAFPAGETSQQAHPMASMHLWPRAFGMADSTMTQEANMSIYHRPAQLCDALASYSQMFSASWMPQMTTVPTVHEEQVLNAEPGVIEENVDEDFEHLSQMSEQDWYEMGDVNDDDYVLV